MAAAHKKAIGQRIAELREAKGWSQPQLAAEIPAQEVDAQQVSKWERGIHTPRKHLAELAAALGTSEGDILAGIRGNSDGPTPDPFAASEDERLGQIESDLSELRLGLADALELLAETAARQVEVDARRLEADASEPEPQPHEPERVRRLSELRQRAERLRRPAGSG